MNFVISKDVSGTLPRPFSYNIATGLACLPPRRLLMRLDLERSSLFQHTNQSIERVEFAVLR
jgi:hypothetical protein